MLFLMISFEYLWNYGESYALVALPRCTNSLNHEEGVTDWRTNYCFLLSPRQRILDTIHTVGGIFGD